MALQMNLTEQDVVLLLLPTGMYKQVDEHHDSPTIAPLFDEVYTISNFGEEEINESYMLLGGNDSNSNRSDWFDRDGELKKAEIAVLATILYLAIFGNGIVLLVLRLRRQKLTRMQWFIAHLALADLFVAFFNILPQLIWDITEHFYGNDFICRAIKYFQVAAMYSSSYVLVMAAIDRYLSICHPLTSQTLSPKRVHMMICLAWTVSLTFSLPQVFLFRLKNFGNEQYDCVEELSPGLSTQAYVTWIFASSYAIPFLILAFCYGKICHVVWVSVGSKGSSVYVSVRNGAQETADKGFRMKISFRRMRDRQNSSVQSRDRSEAASIVTSSSSSKKPRGHQRGVSKSKMKTIKLTLAVVLCYLICWAPFFFVQMWTSFDDSLNMEYPHIVIIMLLASLNSCTNPWIYLAFSGRPCTRSPPSRHASRSWGPSTHVTSGDSNETKTRTSLVDLSHARLSTRNSSSRFFDKVGQVNSKC